MVFKVSVKTQFKQPKGLQGLGPPFATETPGFVFVIVHWRLETVPLPG